MWRISRIVVRNFPGIGSYEFDYPKDPIVLTGPNGSGKTSMGSHVIKFALSGMYGTAQSGIDVYKMDPEFTNQDKIPIDVVLTLNNKVAGQNSELVIHRTHHEGKRDVKITFNGQPWDKKVYDLWFRENYIPICLDPASFYSITGTGSMKAANQLATMGYVIPPPLIAAIQLINDELKDVRAKLAKAVVPEALAAIPDFVANPVTLGQVKEAVAKGDAAIREVMQNYKKYVFNKVAVDIHALKKNLTETQNQLDGKREDLYKQLEEVMIKQISGDWAKLEIKDGDLCYAGRPISPPYYSTGELLKLALAIVHECKTNIGYIFIKDFTLLDDKSRETILKLFANYQIIAESPELGVEYPGMTKVDVRTVLDKYKINGEESPKKVVPVKVAKVRPVKVTATATTEEVLD